MIFISDFDSNNEFSFAPYNVPSAAKGRWIAMDVADWTGNGLDEILLSNKLLNWAGYHS